MELLESQDPEKKKLIETSERHRKELEKEMKEISDSTERVVKNALIIGGALAVTYLLVNSLQSRKKKKKKNKSAEATPEKETASYEYEAPSFLSTMGERIASQATLMVLQVAKEKLAEYLNKPKEK